MSEYKRQLAVGASLVLVATLGFAFAIYSVVPTHGVVTVTSNNTTTSHVSSPSVTSSILTTRSQSTSLFSTQTVLTSERPINLGTNPFAPIVDPSNGMVYAPTGSGNSLLVVSGQSNKLIVTVSVGLGPETPVLDTDNGHLYVPNSGGDTVSVVSSTSNAVVDTIQVGVNPLTPAFDPDNGDIYVPNCSASRPEGNTISVISGSNDTVITTIQVANLPVQPVFDSANGDIYVATLSGPVSVISGETNTVIATIQMPGGSGVPAYNPFNGDIYVPSGNTISVISGATNTLTATVDVEGAWTPVLDSATGNLYVPSQHQAVQGELEVMSGRNNSIIATIPVGQNPQVPVFDSANGDVYVTNLIRGGGGVGAQTGLTVPVISGSSNSLVANFTVPYLPWGGAFNPWNGEIYLSSSSALAIVSGATNMVVATVQGPAPG